MTMDSPRRVCVRTVGTTGNPVCRTLAGLRFSEAVEERWE